jgi:hypothetical protein
VIPKEGVESFSCKGIHTQTLPQSRDPEKGS